MSDRNIERMIEYLLLKGWTEKEIKVSLGRLCLPTVGIGYQNPKL